MLSGESHNFVNLLVSVHVVCVCARVACVRVNCVVCAYCVVHACVRVCIVCFCGCMCNGRGGEWV